MTWLGRDAWLRNALRLLVAGLHGRYGLSVGPHRSDAPK